MQYTLCLKKQDTVVDTAWMLLTEYWVLPLAWSQW